MDSCESLGCSKQIRSITKPFGASTTATSTRPVALRCHSPWKISKSQSPIVKKKKVSNCCSFCSVWLILLEKTGWENVSECALFSRWMTLNRRQCQQHAANVDNNSSCVRSLFHQQVTFSTKTGCAILTSATTTTKIKKGKDWNVRAGAGAIVAVHHRSTGIDRELLSRITDSPLKVTSACGQSGHVVWPVLPVCLTYISLRWLNIYSRPPHYKASRLIWMKSDRRLPCVCVCECSPLSSQASPGPLFHQSVTHVLSVQKRWGMADRGPVNSGGWGKPVCSRTL